jgi:hypothetical protein
MHSCITLWDLRCYYCLTFLEPKTITVESGAFTVSSTIGLQVQIIDIVS